MIFIRESGGKKNINLVIRLRKNITNFFLPNVEKKMENSSSSLAKKTRGQIRKLAMSSFVWNIPPPPLPRKINQSVAGK